MTLENNYPEANSIHGEHIKQESINKFSVRTMLCIRLVLFAIFQAIIALIFTVTGHLSAWDSSAGWWQITASLASLCSLAALQYFLHREGSTLKKLYHIEREYWKKDVLLVLGLAVLGVVIAMLPNPLLSTWLFGSPEGAVPLLFRPLPAWAAWLSVVAFPISIALSELPIYMGYALPRIEALTGSAWKGIAVAGFFLAAQHITLPLIFDGRFILYRFAMYLPLALFMAIVLRWKPRLLPYMMIIHGLMDLSAALYGLSMNL
jgi:hypothetical protein